MARNFLSIWRRFSPNEHINMFKVPGVLLSQSNHKVLFNFKSIKLKHQLTTPQGYDSGIEVYCRIRQKNVPLILLNQHFVKWYICGPTVYDSLHIGHASCYIRFDIINRILKEFFNINPVVALGITDIDDKIIKRSLRKKVDFRFLAKQFELEFFDHLNKLNVLPPSFVLRVSDHIPDIISFISKIIEKGDAYPTEDGSVYFNNPEPVENFKLIHSSLKIGQKSHSDFALWKGAKIDEPYWDSPWGRGRPGWHIECSAMASKIFGSQLDLHGGGNDLWFPHHENEEKQSCSYHGCNQWVNYWLYTGLLHISNEKMSKSLQNFITVSEFLKSHTPDHLRMFSFITKYNLALHWDSNAMSVPVNSCEAISKFLGDADAYVRGNWTVGNVSESALLQELEETKKRVKMHLANDFDTHNCHNDLMKLMKSTLAMMSDLSNVSTSRSPAAVAVVSEYIRDIYTSFGFQLKAVDTSRASAENKKLEFVIDQVINFRSQVRDEALSSEDNSTKGVLLNACDTLRKDLEAVGIVIKDFGKNNSSWSFAEKGEKTAESAGA